MPTPVPEKRWVKIVFYPAAIFFGGGALIVWVLMHLVALDFACRCSPIPFPDWGLSARIFGAIVVGAPLLLTDWFVWWKWRDHRRKEKWAAAYAEKHAPWYARKGSERPAGPIKNKWYDE
ncbi:MAG: hypothetical protein E2O75_07545 [Chloroflexi bacterium]|nr:MAG: hypothetical protein E2O75_07545 [Chloroflexota bacterium]